jgi:protein SCO1/2
VRALAALVVLVLSMADAEAALSRAELGTVAVNPPVEAHLDLGLAASDTHGTTRTIGDILAGRPALLSFVDYTCKTICGTDLELLAAAIQAANLSPSDYRILVLGIDPKDSRQSASAMEEHEIPAELRAAGTFLLPDRDAIARATGALGFRYVYDRGNDQFAHPAVIYVIAPDGGVRGALSPFALTAADIERVLGSSEVKPLNLYDRVRLLCYGYDPATGLYTARISTLLRIGAALTVILLGTALVLLIYTGKKTA